MEKEKLIEKVRSINDVSKQRDELYAVLDELGITYRRTNCKKCLRDLLNIAKEELRLIEDASAASDFNGESEYVYLLDRAQSWNGHIIDQNTPAEVVREFVKAFPKGYYRRVEK